MPQPLRQHLRDATDDAHRTLDAAIVRQGLFESTAGYRRFLIGWHRLQGTVENALERHAVEDVLPDWPRRRRLALIEADLAVLGIGRHALAAPATLRIGSTAALLGAAYVVEGATLGGRVVRPRIEALGSPASEALRFLSGDDSGRLWRSFLDALERHADAVDPSHVVDAALEVFALAADCFRPRSAPG